MTPELLEDTHILEVGDIRRQQREIVEGGVAAGSVRTRFNSMASLTRPNTRTRVSVRVRQAPYGSSWVSICARLACEDALLSDK